MADKKKMTIADFKKFKEEGRKFSYVTAYDYTTASIVNDSEVEIILVGDSLGMIMLGYKGTESVTMDDMVHHIRPVVKGAPNTWIVGDMPFGSYNVSDEEAVRNANRLIKETNCDCIKLEGGIEGFIKNSELAQRRVARPEDVVKVGDAVQVKVLDVRPDERRIELSRKSQEKR